MRPPLGVCRARNAFRGFASLVPSDVLAAATASKSAGNATGSARQASCRASAPNRSPRDSVPVAANFKPTAKFLFDNFCTALAMFGKSGGPPTGDVSELWSHYTRLRSLPDPSAIPPPGQSNQILRRLTRHQFRVLLKVLTRSRPFVFDRVRQVLEDMMMVGMELEAPEWNQFIVALGCQGDLRGVDRAFKAMVDAGVKPTARTYECLMEACSPDPAAVVNHFKNMREAGFVPNESTYHYIVRAYVKAGDLENAERYFNAIREESATRRILKPSLRTVHCLMQDHIERGNMSRAVQLYNLMLQFGVKPTLWTFTHLLRGFADKGDLEGARLIHRRLRYMGYKPDLVFYSILIDLHAKKMDMSGVSQLLSQLKADKITPDRVLFNTIIDGYGKMGILGAIRENYEQMISMGIQPDAFTFTSIIDAHMKVGDIEGASQWLECMTTRASGHGTESPGETDRLPTPPQQPVKPDVHIFTTLVDGYARSGDMSSATGIFHSMEEAGVRPNIVTFGALIHGHCQAGDLVFATRWLERIADAGLCPDAAIYNTLVAGFAAADDFEGARAWMDAMTRDGLHPTVATYAIMIDAHLRLEHFPRAIGAFDEMLAKGVQPNTHIFTVLITALGHQAKFQKRTAAVPQLEGNGGAPHDQRDQQGTAAAAQSQHGEKEGAPAPSSQPDMAQSIPGFVLKMDNPAVRHREIYHVPLLRIYARFRETIPFLPPPPPVYIYDAMIAHFLQCEMEKSALQVYLEMIEDGCIPNMSITLRLARRLCRLGRWSLFVNWAEWVKRDVLAGSGVGYDEEEGGLGPLTLHEAGMMSVHQASQKSIKRLRVGEPSKLAELEKTLTAAVTFTYGQFALAWSEGKKEPELEGHRRAVSLVEYNETSNQYQIAGQINKEDGAMAYWDAVVAAWSAVNKGDAFPVESKGDLEASKAESDMDMPTTPQPPIRTAKPDPLDDTLPDFLNLNSEPAQSTDHMQIPPTLLEPRERKQSFKVPQDPTFTAFLRLFLRHCELHDLWRARQRAVEWATSRDIDIRTAYTGGGRMVHAPKPDWWWTVGEHVEVAARQEDERRQV
ncbi:hypothetical protein HK104_008032 [Borealophlyctis nickersoniae]|nr:hypothetical protein HK104_008032 [Borealophlyctis nickersoniae]